LEDAGLSGDLSFVHENGDNFLMMLVGLLRNINDALKSPETSGGSKGDFDAATFTTRLAALREALNEMDIDVINESVDSLLGIPCADSEKAFVRKISHHILMVDYEEAEALIESYLKKSNSV
jgi:hypothetical protein